MIPLKEKSCAIAAYELAANRPARTLSAPPPSDVHITKACQNKQNSLDVIEQSASTNSDSIDVSLFFGIFFPLCCTLGIINSSMKKVLTLQIREYCLNRGRQPNTKNRFFHSAAFLISLVISGQLSRISRIRRLEKRPWSRYR